MFGQYYLPLSEIAKRFLWLENSKQTSNQFSVYCTDRPLGICDNKWYTQSDSQLTWLHCYLIHLWLPWMVSLEPLGVSDIHRQIPNRPGFIVMLRGCCMGSYMRLLCMVSFGTTGRLWLQMTYIVRFPIGLGSLLSLELLHGFLRVITVYGFLWTTGHLWLQVMHTSDSQLPWEHCYL